MAKFILTEEASAPATPSTNNWAFYFKSDGLYFKDDAGTETGPLSAGAGVSDGDYGDITVSSSGTVFTIDSGVVTLAKMANMATDSFIGRDTAGTGAPEVLSVSTVQTMLSVLPTTGGTITGAVNLGENAGIILDTALSADGKYSGITEGGTAGAALVFGDLCYLQTADSRWEKVDANAAATCSNKLGICVLAAAGDASATTMLLYGKIRADSVFPTLTIGAPVFASTTAGAIQTTAPSGAADIIRIIGYGNTADELHFCPSNDYFEHV